MSTSVPDFGETSDDDDDDIDMLMYLLDDHKDISTFSGRADVPKRLLLLNHTLNENGEVIYRDSQVLGNHTAIRIPTDMLDSERILLSIFLDYDVPLTISTTVKAPGFFEPDLTRTHRDISIENKIGAHQLWVRPSGYHVSSGVVVIKSRLWQLSQGFRKVVNVRWPKFVVCATAFRRNDSGIVSCSESCISPSFEVRSKEQSNKTRASRGEAAPIRHRRTPETEARASTLREIQARIIDMRSVIADEKRKTTEYETRMKFIRAIAASSNNSDDMANLLG
jgi:hypothetical protein